MALEEILASNITDTANSKYSLNSSQMNIKTYTEDQFPQFLYTTSWLAIKKKIMKRHV